MTAISVQTDSNEFRFGTQSLKVTTGDTGDNALFPADAVAVTPDESRTFSCYVKTSALLTGGEVYLRVAQAGILTPVLAESEAVTDTTLMTGVDANGWVRIIVTLVVPSGVFTVRPFIQYTGVTAGQVFWIDGVKFERGAVASQWQENIVSPRAIVDQSGFQVDASQGGIVRYRGALGGARDTVALGDHGLLFGGDTEVYSDTAGMLTVEDGIRLPLGGDVTLASTDHPLQVGPDSDANVAIDGNEIQARNNGAAANLAINLLGGEVDFGGNIDLNGSSIKNSGGTSFPVSPVAGEVFYHLTHNMWFVHDGAQWVCTCPHVAVMTPVIPVTLPLAATTSSNAFHATLPVDRGLDILVEAYECFFFVESGGTALGASHKWVAGIVKRPAAVTVGTLNIDSGSSAVYRTVADATDDVVDLTSGEVGLTMTWTKTGTPGDLRQSVHIAYRFIGA